MSARPVLLALSLFVTVGASAALSAAKPNQKKATTQLASAACGGARAELAQAQRALTKALRNADGAGAAYHACLQRSKNGRLCGSERKTLSKAMAEKRRGGDAVRFAAAKKKQACGS